MISVNVLPVTPLLVNSTNAIYFSMESSLCLQTVNSTKFLNRMWGFRPDWHAWAVVFTSLIEATWILCTQQAGNCLICFHQIFTTKLDLLADFPQDDEDWVVAFKRQCCGLCKDSVARKTLITRVEVCAEDSLSDRSFYAFGPRQIQSDAELLWLNHWNIFTELDKKKGSWSSYDARPSFTFLCNSLRKMGQLGVVNSL